MLAEKCDTRSMASTTAVPLHQNVLFMVLKDYVKYYFKSLPKSKMSNLWLLFCVISNYVSNTRHDSTIPSIFLLKLDMLCRLCIYTHRETFVL